MSLNMDSWPWKIALILAIIGVREFVRLLSPKDATGAAGENSRWLIETLDSAAIAIGLVLFLIQPFLLQAFFIPSGSMEDTLQVRDRLLVSKLIYRLREPRFQDVVVFRAPPEALGPGTPEGTDFIKRCIGTPGDIVYVKDRQLYRIPKGTRQVQKINEPYTKWSPEGSYSYDMKIIGGVVYSREYTGPDDAGTWRINGVAVPEGEQDKITQATPQAVPSDKFFMLGDHRNNSNDGHVWGFVPRANIVGKAIFVFWPPTRMALVDRLSHPPHVEVRNARREPLFGGNPHSESIAFPARP
jgi:signal peptidase I